MLIFFSVQVHLQKEEHEKTVILKEQERANHLKAQVRVSKKKVRNIQPRRN